MWRANHTQVLDVLTLIRRVRPHQHHLSGPVQVNCLSRSTKQQHTTSPDHWTICISKTMFPLQTLNSTWRGALPWRGVSKGAGGLLAIQTGTPPTVCHFGSFWEKNENPCPLPAGQWPWKTPHCPLEASCATTILPQSPRRTTGGWKDILQGQDKRDQRSILGSSRRGTVVNESD